MKGEYFCLCEYYRVRNCCKETADSKTILTVRVATKNQTKWILSGKGSDSDTDNIGLRECRVDRDTKTWNSDASHEKFITYSYNTVTTDQNSSTTSRCAHTQWQPR